jgi:hypothetical protein
MPKSASPTPPDLALPEWVSAARIAELTGLTRRRVLQKIRKERVGELRPLRTGAKTVQTAVFAPRSWVVAVLHERAMAIEAAAD